MSMEGPELHHSFDSAQFITSYAKRFNESIELLNKSNQYTASVNFSEVCEIDTLAELFDPDTKLVIIGFLALPYEVTLEIVAAAQENPLRKIYQVYFTEGGAVDLERSFTCAEQQVHESDEPSMVIQNNALQNDSFNELVSGIEAEMQWDESPRSLFTSTDAYEARKLVDLAAASIFGTD